MYFSDRFLFFKMLSEMFQNLSRKRKTAKASREKTESVAAETQEAGYPEKDRDKEESGRCQTVKAEEDSVFREKEDVL